MLLFWYYCPTQIVPYTLVHKIKEKKREKKQKTKYLTMICKGVFFYEVLYPFLEAEKHDNLYQRRV